MLIEPSVGHAGDGKGFGDEFKVSRGVKGEAGKDSFCNLPLSWQLQTPGARQLWFEYKGGIAKERNLSGYCGDPCDVEAIALYDRHRKDGDLLTRKDEKRLFKLIQLGKYAEERLFESDDIDHSRLVRLECYVVRGRIAVEELVDKNIGLILRDINKYRSDGLTRSDLYQEGLMALLKAISLFDWRRGNKFSSYAVTTINRALVRAIDDQAREIRTPVWLGVQMRKMLTFCKMFLQENGREPSISEIAHEFGLAVNKVQFAFSIPVTEISLNMTIGDKEVNELGDRISSCDDGPDSVVFASLLSEELDRLLQALPAREERVVRLKYGLDDGVAKDFKEIGKLMELTRERVRQIFQEAMSRLRQNNRNQSLRDYLD